MIPTHMEEKRELREPCGARGALKPSQLFQETLYRNFEPRTGTAAPETEEPLDFDYVVDWLSGMLNDTFGTSSKSVVGIIALILLLAILATILSCAMNFALPSSLSFIHSWANKLSIEMLAVVSIFLCILVCWWYPRIGSFAFLALAGILVLVGWQTKKWLVLGAGVILIMYVLFGRLNVYEAMPEFFTTFLKYSTIIAIGLLIVNMVMMPIGEFCSVDGVYKYTNKSNNTALGSGAASTPNSGTGSGDGTVLPAGAAAQQIEVLPPHDTEDELRSFFRTQ